jgi:hypothetical protein
VLVKQLRCPFSALPSLTIIASHFAGLKRQFNNRVLVSKEKLLLWLQDIVHMPTTKSTRERRDVLFGYRRGGRVACYEQIDHLASMLAD